MTAGLLSFQWPRVVCIEELRGEIQRLNNSSKGNLRRLIHFFDDLGVTRFKEAHAVGFARYKRCANVAHVLSFRRELVTGFNRRLLRGSQLVHLNSR